MERRDELSRAIEQARAEDLDAAHARHRAARVTSLLATWALGWLRLPARARPEPLPDVLPGEVGLTFGGHATVLVRYADATIACDPMLGGRLGVVRRAERPGLAPGDLEDVKVVVISNRHAGHLHPPTLRRLPRRAVVIVPPGLGDRVRALGFERVEELAAGSRIALGGVEVAAEVVPRDGDLTHAYLLAGDGPKVLFCGDGAYGPAFSAIGAAHHPAIACLPIGGYVPRSFRRRHMSPLDALSAFEDLGARMMVPIRHGTFALSYERLGEPRRWLEGMVAARELASWVTVLGAGKSAVFT